MGKDRFSWYDPFKKKKKKKKTGFVRIWPKFGLKQPSIFLVYIKFLIWLWLNHKLYNIIYIYNLFNFLLPYCRTLQKPQFTVAISKQYLTSKELVNVLTRQTDIKFRALMLAGKGKAIRSDQRKDKIHNLLDPYFQISKWKRSIMKDMDKMITYSFLICP